MRLRDFNYATPGGYFVTICTAGRAGVLVTRLTEKVRQHVVDLAGRFPGLTIDELEVMPDHVHVIFLLDGRTPPLPRIVQAFKSLTTFLVPRDRWPLWQRGYYEHVIRDEGELEVLREYIQNNQLAAQIRIKGG